MNFAKERMKIWHPWPLKQLELLQGTTFTHPYCQRFAQTYVIGTVRSGRGILRYRKSRYEIASGHVYVIEPGEVWGCQSDELTFSHLRVDPELLQHGAAEIMGPSRSRTHFPESGRSDLALSQTFENLYAGLTTPAFRLEQQELLLEALAQLFLSHGTDRAGSGHRGWEQPTIGRVKAYLAQHYTEDVSLDELASIAKLSVFHLVHAFRQANGLPPHAYQIQLRMWHARKLLAQGFSVGYVAHETGFFDQTHFTHQFKRHVGVTPGSYRKTAKFY